MKYLSELSVGEDLNEVFVCKEKKTGETKTGKTYRALKLGDKTGTMDAKVWEVEDAEKNEYNEGDFIRVIGKVDSYRDNNQIIVSQVGRAADGTYEISDYVPVSDYDIDEMWNDLMEYRYSVGNPYLRMVLDYFFDSEDFCNIFKGHSAAKGMHHAFAGGLLQHTLRVTQMCAYLASRYTLLNYDLLITAAICHDIGKVKEISDFPENQYTDEGNMLGHIVMGVEMIDDAVRCIPDFPQELALELKHCITAHHGQLDWGSPETPHLAEAEALHLADQTDAKMEAVTELITKNEPDANGWYGNCPSIRSTIRKTVV